MPGNSEQGLDRTALNRMQKITLHFKTLWIMLSKGSYIWKAEQKVSDLMKYNTFWKKWSKDKGTKNKKVKQEKTPTHIYVDISV